MSDRQTACSGCARWKATPGTTGKTQPKCLKRHVFYTDQSLMDISHSPPTVQSLVIPTYPRTRIPVFYTCRSKPCSPWTLLCPGLLMTMMSSASLAERNPVTLPFMATSFLNAWLAGPMTHCNRSIQLLLSLVSMSRAVHIFFIRN